MLTQGAWATTAYVSTYAELSAAISNASVDVIIVTANIDVPCETSKSISDGVDETGASTAQLIINRSLTLQSQAGSKYIIKRVAANGADATKLKSLIAIRGTGQGNSGTANLTQNTVEVSFTNIIIDGGAVWGSSTVCERRNGAANAYGNAGRSIIDVYLGGVLNLEDGVEIRNGFTTKSDNSLLNDASTSQCFGGAVRVDYHNATGGGTVNIKAGAVIHDCATLGGTSAGYGGALGAYNYARLNLYGGTISDCSSAHGGAIACTYRGAEGYGTTSAGTIRMYGGTISDCCATYGGAISMDGTVDNYLLGGTITSCSASSQGGAVWMNAGSPTLHIVASNSGWLTISECTPYVEGTESTGNYPCIYMQSGSSISSTPVYQVTFRNNNTDFAVLHVLQGNSLGEAFPAAPAKAGISFLGWYNGNTQVTSSTAITDNITVTAKWDFYGSGTLADPYQIPSADAWDFMAYNVNNGDTYSSKYFQLTNNISVTTMVGASTFDGHFLYFSGIFDGDGKTLNVELVGTTECTAAFSALNNASIKNLHIKGSINTTNVRPASIAGFVNGSCTIENCWSEVAITSSKKDYWVDAGAFVARVNGDQSLTLTGCLFTGSITYKSTAYEGGGMVGWTRQDATVTLNNCVFAPSTINITMTYNDQYVFVTGLAQKNINDCYYNDVANSSNLIPEPDDGSKLAYSITAGTNVTISNLGAATATYDVSGITAYAHGVNCGGMFYAGSGDAVSLNLTATNHTGYSVYDFTASAGTLTGTGNPYSLTMAAENVNINARYSTTKSITATPSASAASGWYLIASPFVSVTPSEENGFLTNQYDLFRFNQSAELEWENWKDNEPGEEDPRHFDLESGRGYLYANSGNVTLTFIGTPYSGTGVVNLEYSTSNPDSRMHGWNLIGNPYGETATITNDCYKMNDLHNDIIACTGPVEISAMEGVFVHATGINQTVTFATGAKRETAGVEDNIVINLSDNKGNVIDRAIVSFEKEHTLPKFQIKDNSTKLYIPQNGVDYAMAFSYRIGELPLNFKANETSVYTLSFSGENMNSVSLVDMIEGAVIDLSVNDTYSFVGASTDRADRFKLVFSSSNDSNIDIFAYQTGNEIIVSGEGELQVFDVMGRMVMQQRIDGVQTVTQPLQTGVYILRLNEMVQKIVVR